MQLLLMTNRAGALRKTNMLPRKLANASTMTTDEKRWIVFTTATA
jgi:hypothetical protein